MSSCHHPNWLSGILKSPFLKCRRNCSDKKDFLKQSEIIWQRFLEKVYSEDNLDATIQQVVTLDREIILAPKDESVREGGYERSFHTTYSSQHRMVNQYLKKHWRVIKSDEILGPALPEQPKVIFRKAPGLRHLIAPNVVEPPIRPTFFVKLKGFFPLSEVPCMQICGFQLY